MKTRTSIARLSLGLLVCRLPRWPAQVPEAPAVNKPEGIAKPAPIHKPKRPIPAPALLDRRLHHKPLSRRHNPKPQPRPARHCGCRACCPTD